MSRELKLSASAEPRRVGLRERKKARTRAEIQAHALRLFMEQGYEATTVQQIIEVAEVSESTFFRYFPSKGDVVLLDNYDPLIVGAFLRQPPELSSIQALRAAFRTVFEPLSKDELSDERVRTHLIMSVPELRAAMLDQFASAMRLLAYVISQRLHRPVDDVEVRSLAGAVVGVAVSVMFALADDPPGDLVAMLDQGLAQLEAGFDF